jgi:hypothetical protein
MKRIFAILKNEKTSARRRASRRGISRIECLEQRVVLSAVTGAEQVVQAAPQQENVTEIIPIDAVQSDVEIQVETTSAKMVNPEVVQGVSGQSLGSGRILAKADRGVQLLEAEAPLDVYFINNLSRDLNRLS